MHGKSHAPKTTMSSSSAPLHLPRSNLESLMFTYCCAPFTGFWALREFFNVLNSKIATHTLTSHRVWLRFSASAVNVSQIDSCFITCFLKIHARTMRIVVCMMQGRSEEDNRRAGAIKGCQEFRFFRQGMTNVLALLAVCVCFPGTLPPNTLLLNNILGEMHHHVSEAQDFYATA